MPPLPDSGREDVPPSNGDSDGDGLCDVTEISRGTDPTLIDSDADGFTDYAEVIYGFNPIVPSSPDRTTVFILQENPAASLQIPIEVTVTGSGEDYGGAFESVIVPDRGDQSAETFYVESLPTFAVPSENAAFIDEDAETFRAVVGRTLLGFEVRFAFGDTLGRDCIRAYPFRYNVKRSDGRLIALERNLLLILPRGQTLATGEWCVPDGSCI